jgi:kynurenine formamidase
MFIDLSLPISTRIPVIEGTATPEITQIATIDKKGWNEKLLTFPSHFSTHIDAPYHMIKSGKTLSDYPIESFIGPAIVFDVSGQSIIDIDVDDVQTNDIVFFFTGHVDHIYEKEYFDNNPVISKRTIQKLIKKQISILGIDSFSPDIEPYPIHKELFHHDIRLVENLVNLDQIPHKRFFCYIFPLKIENADGAPCRVVAQVKLKKE